MTAYFFPCVRLNRDSNPFLFFNGTIAFEARATVTSMLNDPLVS